MNNAERQTRSHLMRLFKRHGFHPQSRLGQNFLIDLNLAEFIIDAAEIGPQDVVLEVGTGTGSLTTFMAQRAAAVVSVEVDPRMQALARDVLSGCDNATLLACDALKNKNRIAPEVVQHVQEALAGGENRRMKLVANLPYNIATPLVSNLVGSDLPWERMIITIQWELACRMTARPHSSDYGSLSVWLQSQCRTKVLRRLPPTVFWPRPQVDSAIVRILPNRPARERIADRAFFQDFVRRLFQQRRKLLRSGLNSLYRKQLDKSEIDAILAHRQLPHGARAEQLEPNQLLELSDDIRQAIFRERDDAQLT